MPVGVTRVGETGGHQVTYKKRETVGGVAHIQFPSGARSALKSTSHQLTDLRAVTFFFFFFHPAVKAPAEGEREAGAFFCARIFHFSHFSRLPVRPS